MDHPGDEPIAGDGPRAMPAAFDGAARRAAEQFETGFETPAGVVSWLRERGVEARPPWGFAQVTYARAGLDTSDGLRTPGREYADALETYGVEVGPVWQLRYADLVAGLGLHLATAGGSEAKGASLSAGIRSVRTVSREGTCIRIGFEARREIGETLEVQTSITERRTLAPASSLWLLLGLEIPFRR